MIHHIIHINLYWTKLAIFLLSLWVNFLFKLRSECLLNCIKIKIFILRACFCYDWKNWLNHRLQTYRTYPLNYLELLSWSTTSSIIYLCKRYGYNEFDCLGALKYMLDNKSIAKINELSTSILQSCYINKPHIVSWVLHKRWKKCLWLRIRMADLKYVKRNSLFYHLFFLLLRNKSILVRYTNLIIYFLNFKRFRSIHQAS